MSKNEKDLTQKQLEDSEIKMQYMAENQTRRQRRKHAEALVQMLGALTDDRRYKQILAQLQKEGGETDMCPFLDKMINQGISKGIASGETRGKIAGKAALILEFLGELGEAIDDLRLRVLQEDSLEQLTAWVKLAARAESIEDFCEKAGM